MAGLFELINSGALPDLIAQVNADSSLLFLTDNYGNTPVRAAIYRGRDEIAEYLITSGAPASFFDHCALGHLEYVRQAVAQDAGLVREYSPDGFQALGLAAFFGRDQLVEYLIAQGAKVNVPSRNRMKVQPLHSAAAGSHTRICAMLIAAGADVNAVQQDGYTLLHAAAANGCDELVNLLLKHGADKTAQLSSGKTPADLAADAGHDGLALLLS